MCISLHIPLLPPISLFFFFNDTATTEIYTLSLHDALPISQAVAGRGQIAVGVIGQSSTLVAAYGFAADAIDAVDGAVHLQGCLGRAVLDELTGAVVPLVQNVLAGVATVVAPAIDAPGVVILVGDGMAVGEGDRAQPVIGQVGQRGLLPADADARELPPGVVAVAALQARRGHGRQDPARAIMGELVDMSQGVGDLVAVAPGVIAKQGLAGSIGIGLGQALGVVAPSA